jgi:transcription initiation factor TFIID subunit 6
LKPRITRTLLRAFLSNTTRSSAGTQFGAILGMKSLGAEVIRIVFVGNLRTWSNVVLDNFDQNDENRALLLDQVLDCLSELKKDGQLVASGENSKKHGREGESGNDDFSMDVDEPTKPGESALDDDMKKKLEDRVGKTIASKIIEDPNALLLYYGLYFGEGC